MLWNELGIHFVVLSFLRLVNLLALLGCADIG